LKLHESRFQIQISYSETTKTNPKLEAGISFEFLTPTMRAVLLRGLTKRHGEGNETSRSLPLELRGGYWTLGQYQKIGCLEREGAKVNGWDLQWLR
jgi:hypothetical protein